MFQNTLSEYWSSFCDKVIDWRTTRNLTTLNPNRPLEHLSIIIGCFHLLLYTFRLFAALVTRLILLTLSVTPSKIRQTISPTIKQNCTGSNVWQWTLVISINWDECIIIVMQNRYKYSSPCTTYCTETRQKNGFLPHLSVAKRAYAAKGELAEDIQCLLYHLKTGSQWQITSAFSWCCLRWPWLACPATARAGGRKCTCFPSPLPCVLIRHNCLLSGFQQKV